MGAVPGRGGGTAGVDTARVGNQHVLADRGDRGREVVRRQQADVADRLLRPVEAVDGDRVGTAERHQQMPVVGQGDPVRLVPDRGLRPRLGRDGLDDLVTRGVDDGDVVAVRVGHEQGPVLGVQRGRVQADVDALRRGGRVRQVDDAYRARQGGAGERAGRHLRVVGVQRRVTGTRRTPAFVADIDLGADPDQVTRGVADGPALLDGSGRRVQCDNPVLAVDGGVHGRAVGREDRLSHQ